VGIYSLASEHDRTVNEYFETAPPVLEVFIVNCTERPLNSKELSSGTALPLPIINIQMPHITKHS